jgi:H/ACA ribonucleoprotein complex subunit 2
MGAEKSPKKMKKEKKDKKDKKPKAEVEASSSSAEASSSKPALGANYDSQIDNISVIASPIAPKKLNKRLLKGVKKSAEAKMLRRGVKEVVKAIRKGEQGYVLIAGDINPIDVITHVPVLCEEADIPYVYVPSKEDLGHAGCTKRPTSVVMVRSKGDDSEYTECFGEVKSVPVA